MQDNLFAAALACLRLCEPEAKVAGVRKLATDFTAGMLVCEPREVESVVPGLPSTLRLVLPRDLPHRSLATLEGRAALIHSITHIEFNAINLACDAIYRFQSMPPEYYADWLQVAVEEALHFEMLNRRLAELGFAYGDFPGHDGLWQMAEETAYDVMVRMALVPRVLEARGLDVTPDIMQRLVSAGDKETAAILTIILRDEIGHVLRGAQWFRFICASRQLEPLPVFVDLIQRHMHGSLRGPFNLDARLLAGFTEAELAMLEALPRKKLTQR